ncbi:ATPase, BadF/BadG/BcrA/BcrD type [Niveomyces insectorum RCEF 264]|uniref:ATPase, BadF/BadG/BcrA/BcrD type n=1 Tax=Niveomyces insectorum RCEF 264 TaxID=1081102 RepID=A0A167P5Q8_9HYPO|nr:ATPase, BadF/BadG/BcrA/BcrD type [Niveomyces insectorum RCEF 264]
MSGAMALSNGAQLNGCAGWQKKTGTGTPADTELLGQLQTERCDPAWAARIDTLGTADLCAEFLAKEARVVPAVAACLPVVAALVDALVPRLRAGGRVFYVGAGNSGRIAYMDSSEMPATFSADPTQFQALVAGGSQAVVQAREDAEDAEADGAAALMARHPTARDAVIGISASGRTPFVLGALRAARDVGALTAGITNCSPSALAGPGVAQYLIEAVTGPEFVAGSTRLKAGTAAKLILNMISTCTMVRLGKTYRGLMLDVRVRNHKLRARGVRILRQVCGTGAAYLFRSPTTCDDGCAYNIHVPQKTLLADGTADAAIDAHIQRCGNNVKLACAVAVSGLDLAAAQAHLDRVHGHFHDFLALLRSPPPLPPSPRLGNRPDDSDYGGLFLAIDGGGTTCKVTIATRSGILAHGEAGACNVNCVSLDEITSQIRTATLQAVARLRAVSSPEAAYPTVLATAFPRFHRVWAGIAGLQYALEPAALASRLEALFSVSVQDGSLRLTSDSLLLGACVGIDDGVTGGLSVIAGTGSVVTAFRKTADGHAATSGSTVTPVGRAGGWGHLLGDHGSAYDIGRRALQAVLADMELRQWGRGSQDVDGSSRGDGLEQAVHTRLGGAQKAEQFLPRILHDGEHDPKHQIAEMARIVTALAFPDEADGHGAETLQPGKPSIRARTILADAAASLIARIKPLVSSRLCCPSTDVLILSGALLTLPPYRALFLDTWDKEGLPVFKKTVVVDSPSDWATRSLLKETASR